MNYDKIGNFIAEKRKEKGLTQKQLATKLGVTDKAVSKWETGLGCPDVSLLELLSNELDISILELLKGRKIEEEVIPITEADDYVRSSIKYSKTGMEEKIKKYLCNIILSIVTITCIILVFLNINHYLYLNHVNKVSITVDNKINAILNKTKNNIEIIKKDQGNFDDKTYKEIIMYLDKLYNSFTNNPLLINDYNDGYKINDLYEIYNYNSNTHLLTNLYRLANNYTNQDEEYSLNFMLKNQADANLYYRISNSYKYNIYNFKDTIEPYELLCSNLELTSFAYDFLNITNLIIERGGISE